MTTRIERADAPGVRELLELSDAFHAELYPPEGNYLLDVSELLADGVTVVVAREDERAVGMGALVEKPGYAEIKRMFVRDDARGAGIAAGILQSLEEVAVAHGVHVACMRFGFVLGHQGSLPQLLMPISLGMGGRLGSGRQWLSWVHVHDLVRAMAHV